MAFKSEIGKKKEGIFEILMRDQMVVHESIHHSNAEIYLYG